MSRTFSDWSRGQPPIAPPERLSSARQRPASPEERRQRREKRSANDIKLKPASDDLINNLLDSFTSIAPAKEDGADSSVPYDFSPRYSLTSTSAPPLTITTGRSSRRSSFSLPFRDGYRPTIVARPSYAFVPPSLQVSDEKTRESHSHDGRGNATIQEEEEDTAAPPIVPMSRSGSTLGRKHLQSWRQKSQQQSMTPSQAPSGSNSRPISRAGIHDTSNGTSSLDPNQENNRGSSQQLRRSNSRPVSLDVGYPSASSVAVERRDKGKQPVYQVTVNTQGPVPTRDPRRMGMIFGTNGPMPPPRFTSLSSRTSTSDDRSSMRTSMSGRAKSLNLASMKAIRSESERATSSNRVSLETGQSHSRSPATVEMPNPQSLQRTDSLTLLRRRSLKDKQNHHIDADQQHEVHLPGDRTPTQQDFEQSQPELQNDTADVAKAIRPAVDGSNDDELPELSQHGKEVMRRIKELRAASQARLGNMEAARLASASHSRQVSDEAIDAVPPLLTSPPETSLANGQLARAERVREYKLEGDRRVPMDQLLTTSSASGRRGKRKLNNQVSRSESIGIISTSSSRASSIDLHHMLREDTTPTQSRRASRTDSLALARPQVVQNSNRTLRPQFSHTSSRNPSLKEDYVETPSIAASTTPPRRRASPDSVEAEIDAFLRSPRFTQTITTDGERRIAFSEVGDPKGHVVFCCVGMGMTRYIMGFYDELAASLKLRLITPDRPGIGESEAYAHGAKRPVDWPDDVTAICNHLQISEFSLLAHSAGAIYALATALRVPQCVIGRIHLLAPWIPPSQMALLNNFNPTTAKVGVTPRSHRLLRLVPTPILRLSSSSWVVNAGAGFRNKQTPQPNRSRTRGSRRNSVMTASTTTSAVTSSRVSIDTTHDSSNDGAVTPRLSIAADSTGWPLLATTHSPTVYPPIDATEPPVIPYMPANRAAITAARTRQKRYDEALTPAIFQLATRNANPAVDLLVCLERNANIGFRYADVDNGANGGMVIHHGSVDTRVPLENARLLAKSMRDVEIRVLEGEGHGLMASAGVMGSVLTELGREVEELGLIRRKAGVGMLS